VLMLCDHFADVSVDDLPAQLAFAGDHVTFALTGIDMSSVNVGKFIRYFFLKRGKERKCILTHQIRNDIKKNKRAYVICFHRLCCAT